MLAADAEMDIGPGFASLGRGHLHQLSDARLIEGGEGVLLEDARLHVGREELVDVVAADAVGGLRQVVGAEAEELASSAIWSAVRAARGSSIMVPTR